MNHNLPQNTENHYQEEFEAFFHLGFSGNAIIDSNSNWLLINNEMCKILCTSREKMDNLKWHNLINLDHKQNDINIFEQVASGVIPQFSFESEMIRGDGITIMVQLTFARMPAASGAHYIAMQVSDITGQKYAEETLKRNEINARQSLEELEWIYSNAPIGLCHLDLNMRYKRINRFLSEINGFHPNAHIGKKITELIPELKEPMQQVKEKIISTGRPYAREFRRDGGNAHDDVRFFDEIWYPLYDEYRKIIGFGAVVEEITEKKHVLALKAADRRKNELLATLAHEFRNPIGSVSAALELMRIIDESDSLSPRRDRGPLERAERQIRHMKQLVEDILAVTRINQGKIELRLERYEITALVRQAIESIQQRISEKRINLVLDFQVEPLNMMLDPLRVTQIITNLLDNAIKYTEVDGKISLSVKREGSDVILIVRDNGVGIPQKNIPAIFEIFHQIQTAPERKNEGIGIGLALVKSLVELHGGKVEARSDGAGKGATFLVRLPDKEA